MIKRYVDDQWRHDIKTRQAYWLLLTENLFTENSLTYNGRILSSLWFPFNSTFYSKLTSIRPIFLFPSCGRRKHPDLDCFVRRNDEKIILFKLVYYIEWLLSKNYQLCSGTLFALKIKLFSWLHLRKNISAYICLFFMEETISTQFVGKKNENLDICLHISLTGMNLWPIRESEVRYEILETRDSFHWLKIFSESIFREIRHSESILFWKTITLIL